MMHWFKIESANSKVGGLTELGHWILNHEVVHR
jgi:hypothetical protein